MPIPRPLPAVLVLVLASTSPALPQEPAGYGHTYQSYVVRVIEGGRERRNRLMDALAKLQIQTRPGGDECVFRKWAETTLTAKPHGT